MNKMVIGARYSNDFILCPLMQSRRGGCSQVRRTEMYDVSLKVVNQRFRGPFLEGPEEFSHPKSHSTISNLMTTELFYAYILNMRRGSLHIRRFRRIHLSVFKYRLTKNGFAGPKRFGGFPTWLSSKLE